MAKRKHNPALHWTLIGVGAIAAGSVLASAMLARRSRQPRKNPSPRIQVPSREPDGGYQERWSARRMRAISACQTDPEVSTWPQALTCALNVAFPEAAPWTDPMVWSSWMKDAHDYVRQDLLSEIAGAASKAHWQIALWIRGDREIGRCRYALGPVSDAQIALCVAVSMYPNANWNEPVAWQVDFLTEVLRKLST